jgi:hypothetical protein
MILTKTQFRNITSNFPNSAEISHFRENDKTISVSSLPPSSAALCQSSALISLPCYARVMGEYGRLVTGSLQDNTRLSALLSLPPLPPSIPLPTLSPASHHPLSISPPPFLLSYSSPHSISVKTPHPPHHTAIEGLVRIKLFPIYVIPEMKLCVPIVFQNRIIMFCVSQFPPSCICEELRFSQDCSAYFVAARYRNEGIENEAS